MRQTWTYSVGAVTSFFGVIALSSDATTDGGITISPDEPLWREISGVDGQVIRVRASRFSATVRVEVPVSSQAHAELLRWAAVDALTGDGTSLFSLTDPNSGITWNSLGYIEGIPEHAYRGVMSTAVWSIKCPFMVAVSALATPRVQQAVSDAFDN